MLFNSVEFLFYFLPVALLVFWKLAPSPRARIHVMNISSFIFYGAWSFKFLPLLIFSTWFDFFLAQRMERSPEVQRKKFLLLSVVVNLGLLAFFKYFYFLTDSAFWLFDLMGWDFIRPAWQIVLPVGISFYTFQSLSYTIDVYRSHSKPYTDYAAFTAYVCFFPQLVAGPIIRHDEFMPQMESVTRSGWSHKNFQTGLHFFALGLAKKLLLADTIAAGVDQGLLQLNYLNSFEALLCALGYSLQLYYDFSGYSDMAIGLGHFFGFKFPENFNSPYKSASITEFWQRWHMTLSRWLRDYLYISLGGNRKGTFKTYRNLMITMLLGGLWHGAAWNYVIWGGYHGFWLVIERYLDRPFIRGPRRFQVLVTFLIAMIGWIFFRSPSFEFALNWLELLFRFEGGLSVSHFVPKVRDRMLAGIVVGIILLVGPNTQQRLRQTGPSSVQVLVYGLLIYLCLLRLATESPFLYFQF